MQITQLRNKLLLSATAISVLIAIGSMLAVSWVIERQFQDESKANLGNVSAVITSRLAERKDNVAIAARQLATQKNLGSTLWYLTKYGQSNVDREMLSVTYLQLAKDTLKIARVAKLSRIALYDAAGHLVSFALIDKNSEQAGFARNLAVPVFQVAALKDGEEPNRNNLRMTNVVAKMDFNFGGRLPLQESVHYAVMDGMPSIESHVPITGDVFNPDTGKREVGTLGLVVAIQPLDQKFADSFSGFTHINLNVFTSSGFASGGVPNYRNADWADVPQAGSDTGAPAFKEILIEGKGYYQSLTPLYADQHLIGGIAALYSKDIVQKNTRELMQTLGMIALASLLLIFALAWYFATSITRPLTVLSRIFHDVANGKQGNTLTNELYQLQQEKTRHDELGDLAQSFVVMNDAINQKIQQIKEVNSALEHTVQERTSALAASEKESRTLIENSPDTIARYDRECRRIYVNPAFGALAGGGVDALLGKRPSEIPGGENSAIYETEIRYVFANDKDSQFELKWLDKDGREVCSHIRLTAEHDASGNVTSVLGVGRDITELNQSRAELKRKELEKTRFLAAAGHDLRQPLAAANLFLDALKSTQLTDKQNVIIQRLDLAMNTFNGLLDSLLNISKLDASTFKPEYTSICVVDIFNWLEQNFAPLASEKSIAFKLYFPLQKGPCVHGDIGLLKSTLMNLVSNAIKFTTKGGVLISARRRGGEVLFQVWDTGIGISDQHVEHIFDEFYQIDNPQRDRTQGIGLGLSIAKRAMSLLGGEISCRSRIGYGSVFEFRLPIDGTSNAVPGPITIGAAQGVLDQEAFVHGKRFVVVEDDALIAEAMSNALAGMGGEVRYFHSAEVALNQADIGDADYYIVDFMLAGELNGIQFLDTLRQKLGRHINAVLVTGDTSPTFVQYSAHIEWPVLYKPANISQLISALSAGA